MSASESALPGCRVPLPELYKAMYDYNDPSTGKPRGFMSIGAALVLESVLFTLDRRGR